MKRSRRLSAVLLLATSAIPLTGFVGACRDDSNKSEVLTLEGRIEKVDLTAREITVLYFSEKRKEEIVGVAANIPSSSGCPNGEYHEGEVLFVAVSHTVEGAHPVWGASPDVIAGDANACTHCEITRIVMPGISMRNRLDPMWRP